MSLYWHPVILYKSGGDQIHGEDPHENDIINFIETTRYKLHHNPKCYHDIQNKHDKVPHIVERIQ